MREEYYDLENDFNRRPANVPMPKPEPKPVSMLRLRHEADLMRDCSTLFSEFAKNAKVYSACGRYGKKFFNKSMKYVYRNYVKGIAQIEAKIPIYIELPTLKEEGNGMYSETKITDSPSKDKEIVVSDIQASALLSKNSEVKLSRKSRE